MKNITKILFRVSVVGAFLGIYVLGPGTLHALPAGFEIQTIASGLNLPTTVAFAPDGRIFVAEKSGSVRVIKNGTLLAEPVITLSDINNYGDRGLIGMAIDPDFSQNGYLYLSYTYENTPGLNFSGIKTGRIVRVTVVGDIADESTKVVLMGSIGGNAITPSCDNYAITSDCIPSDAPSHTIGGLRFGPDGKLYATTGDGAHFDYADTRSLRAQNLDSLAGKLIRINKDGTAPTDNPFYDGNPNSNRSKIYAYGFRNMFRFNFRPTTGAIYGGDVGWNTYEEINNVIAGGNYGWPCKEGGFVTPEGLGCTAIGAIDPLYTYGHDVNGAGSVTSGAFPTGNAYPPEYLNTFFFGDYAQNWIKTMTVSATDTSPVITDFGTAADNTNGPVEFITGPEGNVYFLAIYTGELNKITHTLGNRQPLTVINGTPTNGLAPLSVNFSGAGSSDPDGNPITFLWNFGDNTTSTQVNPNHVYTNNGVYNATLTVFDNQGGQQTKMLTVTVGNQGPTAQIISPTTGSLYTVGQNLTLTGSGTDPENGNLPASSMSWRVILHHNVHIHVLETHVGNNITITGADHSDPDVYTEIELTVTDSGGLTNKKSVNIYLNNAGSGNGNLVDNPSFETADPQNPSSAASWEQDWWGNLNAIFTYPAPGYEGTNLRGGKVQITSYTSGDAKWVFSPISTQGNTTYTFSDYYTSNVISSIIVQIGYIDGTYSYTDLGTVPVNANWTKVTKTFTTPANARNVTVLHEIDRIGTLSVDNFSLTLGTSTPPISDTTKPLISLTSPIASSTVSGITNISATATDNVAVTGVQFFLDGSIFGAEDTTSPYSIAWNTASSTNATHTVSGSARDVAGNIATTTLTSVTVNNVAPPVSSNMILNPSLEEVNGALPNKWQNNKWGTNTTTFTYPTAGIDGTKAAKITTTAYTSGDAKWYFEDVAVTSGVTYTFTNSYKSNVVTNLTVRYKKTDGTFSYVSLGNPIASTNWTTQTKTITIPAGIVSMTVLHLMNKVGTLEIDNYNLTGPGSADNIKPLISLTSPIASSTVSGITNISATATDNIAVTGVQFFLDGSIFGAEDNTSPYSIAWNTASSTNATHTVSGSARDVAGNIATTTPISVLVNNVVSTTTGPNLINNGDFEAQSGALPVEWTKNTWGNHTVVHTYPVVGSPSGKAVRVEITAYPANGTGDSKWVHTKIPVNVGTQYSYKDKYRSNIISDVIGQYTLSDGTFSYFGLAKEIQPNSNWTEISGTFSPPVGATHVTLFHLISSVGFVEIDDAELKALGSGTPGETVPPVVEFTNPLQGQTVSGIVNITASSTDNVAVTYVFYAVDGAPITGQLTTPPYSFSWNTNTVSNGSHLLKATTHDPSGNNTTANITIDVNNVAPPVSSNMILNPSLEEVNGALPNKWQNNKWGTNTTTFTYPTAGIDGTKAAKITTTAYTSGDAKWYFEDVAVTSGVTYTFTNSYKSNVVTNLTVRYKKTDGTFSYVSLGNPIASTNWTTQTKTITIPAGIVSMTVLHLMNKVGTLEIDNYNLTGPGSADNIKPLISLTSPIASSTVSGITNISATATDNIAVTGVQFFLDGSIFGAEDNTSPYSIAWNTASSTNATHTVSGSARDVAGNIATTTPISVLVNNVSADIVKPTVAITSPANNSTASSTLNVVVNASDNIALSSIGLYVDNILFGNSGNTSPANFAIDTKNYSDGQHNIMARAEDMSGNFATTSINVNFNNPVVDLIPPTVSITSPLENTTVSGVMTANVSAIDNIGVKDVHIIIDGENIGIDDTSPYSASIDTTNLENGDHVLTAYAEDVAGNIGNASQTNFKVFNIPVFPSAPNLVLNNSLETVDPLNSNLPLKWQNGSWGTNTTIFTYPTAGIDGVKAARVEMTSFVDGDAKWFFDNASTTENKTYTFKEQYKSNTGTKLTARFTYPDNSLQYRDIIVLPASSDWTSVETNVVIPPGAIKTTIFHILDSVGFLEVDNYYFGDNSSASPNNFPTGMVSLTFDDGWLSHYDLARPILNTANLKGGFYIITQETLNSFPDNRINNPGFETVGSNPNIPSLWTTGATGTNDAVFTYPALGIASSSAVRIDVSNYVSGEAEWIPDQTTAIGGHQYTYSGMYKSSVGTYIVTKYVRLDNSVDTIEIGFLPPAIEWTPFSFKFYLELEFKTLTIYNSIRGNGFITLDNVDFNRVLMYVNPTQTQQLRQDGHEVSSHTRTHADLATLTIPEAIEEINGSRTDLLGLGVTPTNVFVYPYGSYTSTIKQVVKDAGYVGARSVDRGYNLKDTDRYALQIQQVDQTTTFTQFQTWVDSARDNKTWLILMFHQIDETSPLGVTPALLQQMVNFLVSQNVNVVTMEQGLAQMLP